MLIVPILALVEEYFRKIIRKYRTAFVNYKVHTNVVEDDNFESNKDNTFILTHDRIVNENLCERIPQTDFLVIDEVYKLETDKNDDRVLALNMAYYIRGQQDPEYKNETAVKSIRFEFSKTIGAYNAESLIKFVRFFEYENRLFKENLKKEKSLKLHYILLTKTWQKRYTKQ